MGLWDTTHSGDPEIEHSEEGYLLSYYIGTNVTRLNSGPYGAWVEMSG